MRKLLSLIFIALVTWLFLGWETMMAVICGALIVFVLILVIGLNE